MIKAVLTTLFASTGLALTFNWLSSSGLPLVAPLASPPPSGEFITLEQARERWQSGVGLFLDARSREDYAAGHIPNALNLPADAFEDYYAKAASIMSSNTPMVAYCDGLECEQSSWLRNKLLQMGYTDVKILQNGWTVWHSAGLPVERIAAK